MKYLILCLLLLNFASAACIDINSASIEELDEITWVGPATAQKIVDSRPFDSIEDLTKVSGIGEVKVSDILEEGKACVEREDDPKKSEEEIFEEEPEEKVEKVVLKHEEKEVIILESVSGNQETIYESIESKMVRISLYLLLIIFPIALGYYLFAKVLKRS